MNKNNVSFSDYVIKSVLLNNQFGIKEVKKIEDIHSMIFERQEYQKIVTLIKSNKLESLKKLPEKYIKTSEYLSVMKLLDQNNEEYIVTVYDSDQLWQDPQVIDIFPLHTKNCDA